MAHSQDSIKIMTAEIKYYSRLAWSDHIFAPISIDTWGVDYGLLDEVGHILRLFSS
jgi:hypothetical protein